jgi:hypothetical protein
MVGVVTKQSIESIDRLGGALLCETLRERVRLLKKDILEYLIPTFN